MVSSTHVHHPQNTFHKSFKKPRSLTSSMPPPSVNLRSDRRLAYKFDSQQGPLFPMVKEDAILFTSIDALLCLDKLRTRKNQEWKLLSENIESYEVSKTLWGQYLGGKILKVVDFHPPIFHPFQVLPLLCWHHFQIVYLHTSACLSSSLLNFMSGHLRSGCWSCGDTAGSQNLHKVRAALLLMLLLGEWSNRTHTFSLTPI